MDKKIMLPLMTEVFLIESHSERMPALILPIDTDHTPIKKMGFKKDKRDWGTVMPDVFYHPSHWKPTEYLIPPDRNVESVAIWLFINFEPISSEARQISSDPHKFMNVSGQIAYEDMYSKIDPDEDGGRFAIANVSDVIDMNDFFAHAKQQNTLSPTTRDSSRDKFSGKN